MILKQQTVFSQRLTTSLQRWLLVVLASVFLGGASGCAHCPLCGGEWASRRDLAVENIGPVEMRTIVGKVSCLERVTILPTFEIRVQLVQLGSSASEKQVVAECVVSEFEEFPVSFELNYACNQVQCSRSYGLVAELLSQGMPLFATDTQYKVNLEESAFPYDLVIVRKK